MVAWSIANRVCMSSCTGKCPTWQVDAGQSEASAHAELRQRARVGLDVHVEAGLGERRDTRRRQCHPLFEVCSLPGDACSRASAL
jgi:hypothetical protein